MCWSNTTSTTPADPKGILMQTIIEGVDPEDFRRQMAKAVEWLERARGWNDDEENEAELDALIEELVTFQEEAEGPYVKT